MVSTRPTQTRPQLIARLIQLDKALGPRGLLGDVQEGEDGLGEWSTHQVRLVLDILEDRTR